LIVTAETSTLTIISVPGLAYEKDFRFLQLVIGYMARRVLVKFVFSVGNNQLVDGYPTWTSAAQ
jgi:hypothetical protein